MMAIVQFAILPIVKENAHYQSQLNLAMRNKYMPRGKEKPAPKETMPKEEIGKKLAKPNPKVKKGMKP